MKNYQCPVILKNGNQCKKKRVRDKNGKLLSRCKTHRGKRGMPVVNGIFDKIAEAIGVKDLGPTIKKFTPPASIKNPIRKDEYLRILKDFFEFYEGNDLKINRYDGSELITEIINQRNPGFLKKIIQKEINNLPLIQDTKSIISKQLSAQNPPMEFKKLSDLKGVMEKMKPEDGIALLIIMRIDSELQYVGDGPDEEKREKKFELDKLKNEIKKKYLTSDPKYAPYPLSRKEYEKNKKTNPLLDYRMRREKEELRKENEQRSLWRPILNDDSSDSDSESVRRTAQATPRRRAPSTPRSDIMSLDSSDEE